MPCEQCNVQFTVFRRKRICADCKRYYCSSCLSLNAAKRRILCERCVVFAKRPLLRSDLLRLKPKDLIFYLQSKHISTTGCVEKEELVGLILSHVQQADASSAGFNRNSNSSPTETDTTNSFDSLKQTCQNFFSNISDSFATFEGKATTKSAQDYSNRTQPTANGTAHIFDQPRVSTREIPTYASFHNVHTAQSTEATINGLRTPTAAPQSEIERTTSTSPPSAPQSNSSSSEMASPVVSFSSITTVNENSQERSELNRHKNQSDCECSDDEEITAAFSSVRLPINTEDLNSSLPVATPVTPSIANADAGQSKLSLPTSAADMCNGEESSQSSFEELGAIGGISDDSKTTTDTNSSNMDQWQILDNQRNDISSVPEDQHEGEHDAEKLQVAVLQQQTAPQRVKKVTRRRSDSYINNRRLRSDAESPTSYDYDALILHERDENEEHEESSMLQKQRLSCTRCGKNKSNIRRHVERMRRHLESSQMSEADVKQELQEFLTYLEKRTKSIDCSEADSEAAGSSGVGGGANCTDATSTSDRRMSDNEGIHVYASSPSCSAKDSRFIDLDEFASLEELESLSVKQLKEVLMLNRVEYKGCCEKKELLDRVERLWKNLKTAPAVDKLRTDELCKICMDAPIECVILECGHMATCTSCGKVLSECPICRQYIVRVVRFFRA